MQICQLPFVGGVLSGAIATVLLAVARPTDWIFLASIRVEETIGLPFLATSMAGVHTPATIPAAAPLPAK
jgi:hypothetical protein